MGGIWYPSHAPHALAMQCTHHVPPIYSLVDWLAACCWVPITCLVHAGGVFYRPGPQAFPADPQLPTRWLVRPAGTAGREAGSTARDTLLPGAYSCSSSSFFLPLAFVALPVVLPVMFFSSLLLLWYRILLFIVLYRRQSPPGNMLI